MKEIAINVNPQPVEQSQQQVYRQWTKQWVLAKKHTDNKRMQFCNQTLNDNFFKALQLVKEQARGLVFERDYRKGMHSEPYSMYCFTSSNCYLYLRCQLHNYYEAEYTLFNCPAAEEITTLFSEGRIAEQVKRVVRLDYNAFYHRVLDFQEDKYIHTL